MVSMSAPGSSLGHPLSKKYQKVDVFARWKGEKYEIEMQIDEDISGENLVFQKQCETSHVLSPDVKRNRRGLGVG